MNQVSKEIAAIQAEMNDIDGQMTINNLEEEEEPKESDTVSADNAEGEHGD